MPDRLRAGALAAAASLTCTLGAPPGAEGPPVPRDPSLASGAAGLAVCQAVRAMVTGDRDAAALAGASLDSAIEVMATEPLSTSLYSGFPGVAWAAHLVGGLLADGDNQHERVESCGDAEQDSNSEIDEVLAVTVRRYPDRGSYDLVDGLVGIGAYALARWPRPGAAQCLESVIERLAGRARRDGDGVFWPTTPAQLAGPRASQYPNGGVDLGYAHGMAGVIPLLARAHALGAGGGTARPLLDGAVRWLLAHAVPAQTGPTMPGFVTSDADPAPTRSAWCYGDPGVAMALLLAAGDAGEPGWARAGTDLALQAAARPPEHTGVTEAGLCHGAAGLAHLFARMYQLTGEQRLAQAASSWLERTVSMCSGGTLPAILAADGSGRPVSAGTGLLEGAAGVVLVLLAGCSSRDPRWDQMLFASPVTRAVASAERAL